MIRTRSSHLRPVLSLTSALVFAGCSGAPAPSQPDLGTLIDGLDSDLPAAERTCIEQLCDASTTPAELQACRETRCPPRPESWAVVPTRVRYDGEMAFVQARLSYEPGGFGPVDAPRDTEVYVGCTLITEDGGEIDLAVTTAFPGDLERPFTLNTEVGAGVRDLIFGVWDHKVQPCDSNRMGCKQYGFLLDGNLATWPPDVYESGTRQRILPPTVSVQVRDAGLGAGFPAARDRALALLREQVEPFGTTLDPVTSGPAPAFVATSTVRYADTHDGLVAQRVATGLGASATATHAADLPAAFVLTLSGSQAVYDQARTACDGKQGEAWDACVAAL